MLAVGLETTLKKGRHGVTRDLSPHGLAIVTPSHFTRGDRVAVTVHAGGGVGVAVRGRVTRVDVNAVSSPELWRFRIGVELEDTLPTDFIERGVRASRARTSAA